MSNITQVETQAKRKKMVFLLVLLVLLIVLDGLLTILLINGGSATEGNPILQPLVGDASFMILKIAGALLLAAYLWLRFSKRAMVAAYIGIAGYSLVVMWNTSLIFLA
jgi:hypothetical protein